jgi:putative transposase
MPNHFHLLVQVKSEDELIRFFNEAKGASARKNLLGLRIKEKNKQFETKEIAEFTAKNLEGFNSAENNQNTELTKSIEKLITAQFSNFFNSYAKAFNKQQNRLGSLFMKTFKRIKINDYNYLRNVVNYIHHNPVEAKLSSNLEDWKYSSYHIITSNEETFLKREELIELFHDLENFKIVHRFAAEGGEDIYI